MHETEWSRLVGICGVGVVNEDENYQCMFLGSLIPDLRSVEWDAD